jgi:pilus assembly protein CpaE
VAHLLSREHQGKVLVVDLDLRYGQIVYFFDAKPKYTILDVAENLERLDSSYLQSLFYPCDEYLSLLPAPERLEEAEVFTPAHLEKILSYLKNIRVFRWILLDCCHQMDEVTVKALELSDELMLVTTQSVPALSNARKMLAALELLHLEDLQVALWLNFWQKHGDLTLAEVEDFLGREISGTVRFEPKEVGRSINEGHPLTEILPGHPVSQDLKVIATRIQGEEFLEDHEVSGWSWLKHLWRRG